MAAAAPKKITIRAYPVGFGDCLLLTFHYAATARHVLVDFGTTAKFPKAPKDAMERVADAIKAACGGKLHAVIATHRHRDHISGFATAANGKGTGDVIASCNPDVVIQPWTEDPRAARDAEVPTGGGTSARAFVRMLGDMHAVAAGVRAEAAALAAIPHSGVGKRLVEELAFIGEDNIANPSAVKNLMQMGKRRAYVRYGSASGFGALLPGVTVTVLGPPTLRQSDAIRKQRERDPSEFWQLMSLTAGGGDVPPKLPFRSAKHPGPGFPPWARWFRKRLLAVRAQQLQQIVRVLDDQMNNTSLILLFEVGGYRMLFPGDAQIENWSYALVPAPHNTDVRKRLAGVNLYKVGHHASLNATPKTLLWEKFTKRSKQASGKRLCTVVSTRPGKHGDTNSNTEVPRRTLVQALDEQSTYVTTQRSNAAKVAPRVVEVDVASGVATIVA
jgi:hypothetical protein